MEGTVTWPQAIWILTVVGGAVMMGFLVAWRLQVMRSNDRHEVRSTYEQHITLLQENIDGVRQTMDARIAAIELANAGTLVVLKHLEDFKDEVKRQYDQLREERDEGMRHIHLRLDTIFNATQMRAIKDRE